MSTSRPGIVALPGELDFGEKPRPNRHSTRDRNGGILMLTKKALLVLVCCLVFPICPLLYGQASGSFSGTVTDKTGSVVSGASVKATSQGTGFFRESKTDDSGHYLMPIMPIGDYTIRVESAGFGPAEQKDVRLQVDEHRELDFSLTPASVTSRLQAPHSWGSAHAPRWVCS